MHLLDDDMIVANAACSDSFVANIPDERMTPALKERLFAIGAPSQSFSATVGDIAGFNAVPDCVESEDTNSASALTYYGYDGLPVRTAPSLDDVLDDLLLLDVHGTIERLVETVPPNMMLAKAILLDGEEAIREAQHKRRLVDFFIWVLDSTQVKKPGWLIDADNKLNHAYA